MRKRTAASTSTSRRSNQQIAPLDIAARSLWDKPSSDEGFAQELAPGPIALGEMQAREPSTAVGPEIPANKAFPGKRPATSGHPLKRTGPRAITGETGSKEQPGDKPQTTNTTEV